MARVLLLPAAADPSARPGGGEEYARLLRAAQADRFGEHRLVEHPGEADLILFAITPGERRDLLRHPYVARYRERCFVFDAYSGSLPVMAGVYGCLPRSAHVPGRTRAGHYPCVAEHPGFDFSPLRDDAPFLFSFVGASRTHPLRRELLRLEHPRAYLHDTTPNGEPRPKAKFLDASARHRYYGSYTDVMRASKFVLCPHGLGPSSLRLFEALRMGRVPVILADDWVPVPGPDWPAISIQVPERAVDDLPALLEAREREAAAMGRAARDAWQAWFEQDVAFHHAVEACLDIGPEHGGPTRTHLAFLHLLLRRDNLRCYVRHYVRGGSRSSMRRSRPT